MKFQINATNLEATLTPMHDKNICSSIYEI